jgi:hypothetical protein
VGSDDRFLVDLGDLRGTLEARAVTEQRSRNELVRAAVACYLTPPPTEPSPDPHQVQVMLEEDLRTWVEDCWLDGDQDVTVVVLQLLALLKALFEDAIPSTVLLPLDDEMQAWLATQGQRYRSRGREKTILALLRRASHRPG